MSARRWLGEDTLFGLPHRPFDNGRWLAGVGKERPWITPERVAWKVDGTKADCLGP